MAYFVMSLLLCGRPVRPVTTLTDEPVPDRQPGSFANFLILDAVRSCADGDASCALEVAAVFIKPVKGLKYVDDVADHGDDTVQLFRHAGPEELEDLRATGTFNLGKNSTGKYFADSAEDAAKWGDWLNGGRGGVVSTRVPKRFAEQMKRWEKLDGIGPARFAAPEQLDTLNGVMSRIEFW